MNTGASPADDDHALSRRLLTGDLQAFDDLQRKYRAQVFAFVAARLPCKSDAEDCSHEVWLRVWAKWKTFDGGHFKGWIYQIARNLVADCRRKTGRRGTNARLDAVAEPAVQDTSDERQQREEELAALRECLETVGGDFVDVLVRIKLHGAAVEDVAANLGTTANNVYKQVHRAKKQLEDCVKSKLQ